MTTTELKDATYQALTGSLPICLNCAYFTQHYLAVDETATSFVPCNYGHCTYITAKFKRAQGTCKNFTTQR